MKKNLIFLIIFCSCIFSNSFAYVINENSSLMKVGVVDFPESMSINRYYTPFYYFDHSRNSGEQLVLNDGSIWSIGWWWQHTVSNWNHDDILKLSYHSNSSYNFVKIENLSRNEDAWGNVFGEPDAFNSNCLWIANIDVKSIIVLNNGMSFKVNSSYWVNELNWEPGDLITILCGDDKSYPYALLNHTKMSIISYAKMQQFPIGIMTPMATLK